MHSCPFMKTVQIVRSKYILHDLKASGGKLNHNKVMNFPSLIVCQTDGVWVIQTGQFGFWFTELP